ncbi:unnamed protein product, partial [Discosporangium mesarthrocarpum]
MDMGSGSKGEAAAYANGFIPETLILLHRQFKTVLRTPELALVRICLFMVISLVLGSLFWNSNGDEDGLRKRVAYVAFS